VRSRERAGGVEDEFELEFDSPEEGEEVPTIARYVDPEAGSFQ
jgi:hypothetical protein